MYKNRVLQLVVVVAMLMAVAASGVVVRSASAAETEGPFRASVSGALSVIGELTFELDGTVKANHIGSMRDYQAAGTFTGPSTNVLVETLTAANGDMLTIQCDQVLEEISPGVYRGTDTWTVTGGTGRFSGATGSGTGETIADLNTGTFTKELKGVIAIPDEDVD